MWRAAEHVFLFTLFGCTNCHLAQVEGHLPWLDIACAFGLAWATAHLARAGGNTTVRACLALMALRWASSLVGLALTPNAGASTKTFACALQLALFGTVTFVDLQRK